MRTITLSNGKKFPADWCGAAGNRLSINIAGTGILGKLVRAFTPEAAAEITYTYGEQSQTFAGYTRLVTLSEGGWSPDATLITLSKEA